MHADEIGRRTSGSAAASVEIGIVEVFVAISAPGGSTESSCASTADLTAWSSNTASVTVVQPARSS